MRRLAAKPLTLLDDKEATATWDLYLNSEIRKNDASVEALKASVTAFKAKAEYYVAMTSKIKMEMD